MFFVPLEFEDIFRGFETKTNILRKFFKCFFFLFSNFSSDFLYKNPHFLKSYGNQLQPTSPPPPPLFSPLVDILMNRPEKTHFEQTYKLELLKQFWKLLVILLIFLTMKLLIESI